MGIEKGGASCLLSPEAHCEAHVRSWVDAKGVWSGSFRCFSNCRIPSTTVTQLQVRVWDWLWDGLLRQSLLQLLLHCWVDEKTRLYVCHQCLFLPLTCAMMIGISLPQRLSDLASLFICRTLGGFWKQVWPGWAERSHNFFKTLLWLWRLLPSFQMSLSLLQGLFIKLLVNWSLCFTCFFFLYVLKDTY